jgi:hypothetical protein
MTPIEENKSTAELQLRLAQDVLAFLRQHPLRKDCASDTNDEAKVLMLAQVAATGVPNSLALLGVYP